MKYLCLIYQNEETSARNAQQGVPMSQEYFAFTQEIQKSGHMLGGNALQPANTATTVRVRDGKVSTTDGPFAETKEQLGGYYLLEADDLNDALKVAFARHLEQPASAALDAIKKHQARLDSG